MSSLHYIIIAVVGLAAGLLSGLFGVGGGVLVIPALVFILGFTQHEAQGTSLAARVLPVLLLGAIRYWKAGDVNVIAALILAAGMFVGTYIGAGWAIKLDEIWLKRAFGILFILLGIRYIITKG